MLSHDLVSRMTEVRALIEPNVTEDSIREELEYNVAQYIPYMEQKGHGNPKEAAVALVAEQTERDIYFLEQRYDELGDAYEEDLNIGTARALEEEGLVPGSQEWRERWDETREGIKATVPFDDYEGPLMH
ncbi:hypothetical protein ACXZ66_03405 [Corynebacterium sp. S7]